MRVSLILIPSSLIPNMDAGKRQEKGIEEKTSSWGKEQEKSRAKIRSGYLNFVGLAVNF